MNFTRVALACAAPLALSFTVLSVPAMAKTATHLENAMLEEMDAATRADVTKRASGGETVSGVIGAKLINSHYGAGGSNPGQALKIVAVDYARGVAVFLKGTDTYEVQHFDPKTLKLK